MAERIIRMATPEDAKAILQIYEPYILDTSITFETEIIPVEEMRRRIETVTKQFPWLVCEEDGRILGYAYCTRFKERAAFDWDCECSVYIDESAHRMGIASALYTELFKLVKQQGYFNIYALITYNHKSSEELHIKFGFKKVGVYQKTGYKMGQWWDLLVMVKNLRSFDETPRKVKSIYEIIGHLN